MRQLGEYRLAVGYVEAVAVDRDGLIAVADQIHFDAPEFLAVDCAVAEVIELEICAELTVDAPQHVQIELRRHPGTVVVSPLEHLLVLAQIDADQKRTVLTGLVMHDAQQVECGRLRKIPDRRTRKIDDVAHRHHGRIGKIKRRREICGYRQHLDRREIAGDLIGRHDEMVAGNIDRYICGEPLEIL